MTPHPIIAALESIGRVLSPVATGMATMSLIACPIAFILWRFA